jgi:hypothetical protein
VPFIYSQDQPHIFLHQNRQILFPLPPVSTTPAVPVAKFAAGGAPSIANISANFREKIETTLMLFSGAWGKMIHEKKPEAKNLVTLFL